MIKKVMDYLRYLIYTVIWYFILLIPIPYMTDDMKINTTFIAFPVIIFFIEHKYFTENYWKLPLLNLSSSLLISFFGLVQMRWNHSFCAWFELIVFAMILVYFIVFITVFTIQKSEKKWKGMILIIVIFISSTLAIIHSAL